MAKFNYRMENILNIKLKMEDSARSVFAEAAATLRKEEEKLKTIKRRIAGFEAEGRRLRESTLNIREIRENTEAINNLKEALKLQEGNVERATEALEAARSSLEEAMQERKTQEKLKENAFEEFKKEINAAENKEIDELISYRFGRISRSLEDK